MKYESQNCSTLRFTFSPFNQGDTQSTEKTLDGSRKADLTGIEQFN